jgi:UDP-glucose 4-epimerase
MMKTPSGSIIVTGGAGFIGSELVSQLVDSGAEVTVVDNLVNGKRENIESALDRGARLLTADIRDIDSLKTVIKDARVIYNLACLGVRHSLHSPIENHEVNATATLNLIKACHENGIGRFVHVSTSEVYGTAQWVPMTEEHPTSPETVYGASKLAGEAYARAWYRTHKYPTVVVRPFNAYGPRSHHEGDSGEVIPKMMLRAMAGKPLVVFGDGNQTRDFNHVSDTARAIILAGVSKEAIGQTINIGSGRETGIIDLAREILRVAGQGNSEIEFRDARPGDVMRLRADSTLAATLLKYQPKIELGDGLVNLKTWYEGMGHLAEELLANEVVENWLKD